MGTGTTVAASNYIPTTYTGTGAYRRVYANTGYSYMTSSVYLPSTPAIKLLAGSSDTPYVYTGGWGGGKNATNATDAGFQYSPTYNDWSLFLSVSDVSGGDVSNSSIPRFEAGQTLSLQFGATATTGGAANLQISAEGININGVFVTQTLSVPNVPTWGSGTDTLKRMTSIAQNADDFNDGSFINGVVWSNPTIGTSAATALPWTTTQGGGGNQDYTAGVVSVQYADPNDQPAGETDSISLPVPEPKVGVMLSLALVVWGCVRRKPVARS